MWGRGNRKGLIFSLPKCEGKTTFPLVQSPALQSHAMGQAEVHRSDGRHLAPTQAPPGWDLCLPCVTSLSRSYQTTISCSVCGFHRCWNKTTDIPRRMSAEDPGCIHPSKCVLTLISALRFLWVLFFCSSLSVGGHTGCSISAQYGLQTVVRPSRFSMSFLFWASVSLKCQCLRTAGGTWQGPAKGLAHSADAQNMWDCKQSKRGSGGQLSG